MDPNSDYYRQNAQAFFDATVSVDMSSIRDRFLARLPSTACILDAGCGSGRDARAFFEQGHVVSAFDASTELVDLARTHCAFDVTVRTFAEVDEVGAYDGIWCCASLLHVPESDMPQAVACLWRALRPGGCMYVSLKLGQGERTSAGRRFTDADEAALLGWFGNLVDVGAIETWITEDQRPERTERWINALVPRTAASPHKLITGGSDPFLPHLSHAMSRATEIDIAVAFIKSTGIRLLLPELMAALQPVDAAAPGRRVRVLTSDYLDVTDPEALRLLLLLQGQGGEVRIYETKGSSFHLKAYIFARLASRELVDGTAFIGSSNISRQALQEGLEWNYRVAFPADQGFLEARHHFDRLFSHARSVDLSDEWIERYELRRRPPPVPIEPGSQEQEPSPTPSSVQQAALSALKQTRNAGFRRGLVVLATGLGKTWLAAFDATNMGAKRVLFVAHREEILNQAAQTFVRIRPQSRVGQYCGKSRDIESDVLCASVQTLSRPAHLERFSPQHFDYIVIDEFHHAAAATYRRLLSYFTPVFLLGLTATPDRTDQSDILSLCDDNLVFTRTLFEGIQDQLLSPFHYHGIHDESVDYREVPWRNGRFDPEQLSNKLATLARARHVMAVWQAQAQTRTLAFCVSIAHAEYMAAHFAREGNASAAVYSGSPLGRAEALSQLQDGRLRVLFSVDLFNEGVDLPGIDTVMMLRPTESKILFLQQLGRGLRRSADKTHLTVLDFIGNHKSFLHKPQALFGIGPTYNALADFARDVEAGRLQLPAGCYVNYDLAIIDFLKALDSAGTQKDYEALSVSLGRRPTLTEFYRSGASVQRVRQQHGSWFGLVRAMGDLEAGEASVFEAHAELLSEVEVTSMTKSFKMILLEAWLELEGLIQGPPLDELTQRSWAVIHRRPNLLSDMPEHIAELPDGASSSWARYWRDNPITAWTGANRTDSSSAPFAIAQDRFVLKTPPSDSDHASLAAMLQELVDYRLAAYDSRRASSDLPSNVIPFKPKAATAVDLPYFPNLKIACGHFRTARTDAEEHRTLPLAYGRLDPARHFIARASGNSMDGGKNSIRDGDYLLLEMVSPSNAGGITGTVMAIERVDENGGGAQYLLRVVTKSKVDGSYILRANNPAYEDLPATDEMRTLARLKAVIDPLDLSVGQSFAREDIPALFDEEFNPGSWNVGHVVLNDKKVHVLLVTLNKQGKGEEHRYHDHWVDENTFHWQSQNATAPAGKRGQELIHHVDKGIAIHLFVRENKLHAGKGAPFVYKGKAAYQSHVGSNPMSVRFEL